MTLAWIFAGMMSGVPAEGPALPPGTASAYEQARAGAGRAPGDQVRLALWCEAHGLTAERLHHLGLAVIANPRDAAARGLMGLVSYEDRWRRPEVVAETARADAALTARLADYNARRARTPDTADAQWRLALWCEEAGLKSEATAHLSAVVRLDPSHENAWKRLGCKKYEGRWLNDRAIAAEKADAEAQKAAERKWKPILDRARDGIRGSNPARRLQAEQALDEVADPRAVGLVWSTFAAGAWGQPIAVRVLGQIDSPGASKALAMLAVIAEGAETRRLATETLKGRDPREFAGLLVGLLRDEIKYEVRPVAGPGSPGILLVQGKQVDVRRLYAPPSIPDQLLLMAQSGQNDAWGMAEVRSGSRTFMMSQIHSSVEWGGKLSYDQIMNYRPRNAGQAEDIAQVRRSIPWEVDDFLAVHPNNRAAAARDPQYMHHNLSFNLTNQDLTRQPVQVEKTVHVGQEIAEYQKSALAAQQHLAGDVAALDRNNADARQSNDRVTQVLRAISGRDHRADRELWKAWYIDLRGYAYTPAPEAQRPAIDQLIPLDYFPAPIPVTSRLMGMGPEVRLVGWTGSPVSKIPSCFGAGTPVRTLTGPRAIETLRVGDRVLTQSTASGTLGYRPVVGIHHNPPSPTFLVRLAGDTIVSSPFHRFWKAGKGWVMAREIRAGDRLRLLEAVAEVEGVEAGPVQLVYNLDVAEDADFFAGAAAALVHDNTLPDPRLAPFDGPR